MIVRLKQHVDSDSDPYAKSCEANKNYFVYAVIKSPEEDPEFMINVWGEGANNTMYSIPSEYFQVIDDTIPSDWRVGSYDAYGVDVDIQSFPEMSQDKYFYDKLIDGDQKAVDVFKRYQQKYEQAARDSMSKV